MKKQPFHIKELKIYKMPGFPRGLKNYEGLSPQLNIIAGPNESGKSSTAKAVQKLIWRDQTQGLQIVAHTDIDNEIWDIRIDSSRIKVQRNGKDDELTGLPAAEEKSRYMLALHELIQAEEGNLAQRIIKESIGGYDLDKVRQKLSYSSNISPRSVSQYREYEKANKEFKEQEIRQKEIKKEQEKLPGLNKQKREAEDATKLKELYDKAVDFLEARLTFDQQKELYEEYPEILEKAHGEEYQNIVNLEDEIKEAEEAVKEAEENRNDHQETLKKLGIPKEGVSEQDLQELEERVENLKNLENEIEEIETEICQNKALKDEALKSIDKDMDTSGWQGLNLQDIGELDRFINNAHSTASEKRFLEKEIEELKKSKEEPKNDKQKLQEGIGLLSNWLQEPKDKVGFSKWLMITIAIISVLAAIATFIWWQVGVVGLLLILALVLYGLLTNKRGSENQRIQVRKSDYEKTGLTSPLKWNAEAVRQRLEELIEEFKEASRQEHLDQELEKRTSQLEGLQNQIDDVENTQKELLDRLSILPELPFEDPQSFTSLHWFIVQVQTWQKAHEEVKALQEKLGKTKELYDSELKKCSGLFTKYNAETPEESIKANSIFKNLKQQEEQRWESDKEIKSSKKTIEEKGKFIDNKNDDLKAIYEKLDIEVGNKDAAQNLLEQLDEYKEAKQEYVVSKRFLSEIKVELESHSKFEEEESKIENLDLDQAQDEYQKFNEIATELEEINGKIREIKTKVKSKESDNTLENAIQERDETVLKLKARYDENLSSITGQLLFDQLKNEIRELNRPKVFEEAGNLFNRITKGRYELEIDEKDEPEFIAYDTIENLGKKLDELSSGTRIQLLLSVRLAFVETYETAIKLPILADELLANSDDSRAKEIIEALTEISKNGRQVFYFTAQADEVAKWRAYLSEADGVDYKVIELTGDQKLDDFSYDEKELESFGILHQVPDINGISYQDYGKQLEVDPYNLLLNEPSQLHLWYLFDDLKVFQECLKRGISKWGSLESFLSHEGTIDVLDEALLSELRDKITLLERFQDLYRQGRPKPIDRSVLEKSGAVSGNFIDDVTDKLEEVNGDPIALIKALRKGEVARFLTSKTDELEQYLIENEFIDDKENLEFDEIQSRLQALISNLDINQKKVDEFLKRLVGG